MPVTYTSRKGFTYYLYKTTTPKGKTRYVFARTPKGEPVDAIPAGYTIRESVNGIVSLARIQPSPILADEVAAVQAALDRHPKGRHYRLNVRGDQIEVYEPVGLTADEVVAEMRKSGFVMPDLTNDARTALDRHMQFTPVLRFILVDAQTRRFRAERMSYRSAFPGWRRLLNTGPLAALARELIPVLGTDAFFELMAY